MNKSKFVLGATALAMVAATFFACNKEKTTQQETPAAQQMAEPQDYTLAEMAASMSWEEGKAFFENQPIKDYTAVCEKVLNECGHLLEKSSSWPTYIFGWHWARPVDDCISNYDGICFGIKTDSNSDQSNARGYFEDGKFVIIPDGDEDGFTSDGYLAVGVPIAIQNDSIIVNEGIYSAYYDEESGRYIAVAVDYTINEE